MDSLFLLTRMFLGLAIILGGLYLLGITPYEAGQAVGAAFGSLGGFVEGVRDQPAVSSDT